MLFNVNATRAFTKHNSLCVFDPVDGTRSVPTTILLSTSYNIEFFMHIPYLTQVATYES